MNNLEKEILDIINPSSKEMYGHKFISLKDTCANPEPPYTMRISPLTHVLLNYKKVVSSYSLVMEDNPTSVLTKQRMDYLIKNSPLHYLYPAEHFASYIEEGYLNPLMIALDNYKTLNLTDKQYNHLIKNSDLSVNQVHGHPALVFALYQAEYQEGFTLSEENWSLLKRSAREFDERYVEKFSDKLMIMEVSESLNSIIIEQKIIAAKKSLDATLGIKAVRVKTAKI